jgi:hypothetical protein
MSIRNRLDRIERHLGYRDDGSHFITLFLAYSPENGETMPEIPADVPRCPRCLGGPHVLIEELVSVDGDPT